MNKDIKKTEGKTEGKKNRSFKCKTICRTFRIMLVLIMAFSIASCGKKIPKKDSIDLAVGEAGITIKDDGKVIYQIRESFDEDYFSKDDLKKMVEEELDDFNKGLSEGDKKAELSEFFVKNKECEAAFTFADIDQFVSYVNLMEKPIEDFYMYNGTYGEVDSSIYGSCDMALAAKDAKDDSEKSSEADISDGQVVGNDETENENVKSVTDLDIDGDTKIIILNMPLKVKLNGAIIAVSPDVAIKDGIAHTGTEESFIFYK